ncbi:hypothetical protein JOB18_038261 [Solea senegalensis]|uniref:Uncharacterized protein n=1 Tax=Solea senegalensis TaxID=28829 RepID=A0AAV6RVX9_SOLSE|nr:hypothetical protein JOB18_038261 [Solea senegalensis]
MQDRMKRDVCFAAELSTRRQRRLEYLVNSGKISEAISCQYASHFGRPWLFVRSLTQVELVIQAGNSCGTNMEATSSHVPPARALASGRVCTYACQNSARRHVSTKSLYSLQLQGRGTGGGDDCDISSNKSEVIDGVNYLTECEEREIKARLTIVCSASECEEKTSERRPSFLYAMILLLGDKNNNFTLS